MFRVHRKGCVEGVCQLKGKGRVLAVALLTWVDSWPEALYNLGSACSWLAWTNDTAALFAVINCYTLKLLMTLTSVSNTAVWSTYVLCTKLQQQLRSLVPDDDFSQSACILSPYTPFYNVYRFCVFNQQEKNPLNGLSPNFFGGRCPRRNHVIQIWWRSVKGFWVGWGSKFTLSHWLWWSSLQHSHTTVWACDTRNLS